MNKNLLLIAEYEQQLRMNPQDIDTRWKLVQARYEVITIGDKLLLGRMDMPRIYTDRDAKLVLEGLEGEEKTRFLGQIKNLAACQEALLKVADTDSACDIYLAFDASSSKDAEIARDIYEALSEKGISVYYEPERKVYSNVDAHRLFALHHSKLLILVGTSPECMERESTAGAWMRYLNIMERDSTKHILPAYKEMNPKDFPGGLSKTQGIDVGRIGSVQAILVPRAMELIGAHDQVIVVKKADGKSVNISNLFNRIELLLEDGEFEAAHERLENIKAEHGTDFEQYHYLKLLEYAQARNQRELALAANEDLFASSHYQYLREKGSPKMKEELLGLAEMKIKYQKEQKEDAYVEEIRNAHVAGDYEKVLTLTDEVKNMQGFSRWADIQGFYQAAKVRVDKQRLQAEFRKLVGDGKKFYLNQLKEKEPAKYQMLSDYDTVPKPNVKTGLLALAGIICLICLVVCRFTPEVGNAENALLIGVFACLFYSIVTRIREDGLVPALIRGFLFTLIPIIVIVILVNLIDVFIPFVTDLLVFVVGLVFGLPVNLSTYSGVYGGYTFDHYRLVIALGIPDLVFTIRGIKAFKVYHGQRSKRQQVEKEYQQLFSSGFLKDFQKKEYNTLVERYKEAMGTDWVEPVEIAKKGRRKR